LQARLDRLSSLERITLQRAAVIGRVFWDTAVVLMNATAENSPIREPETLVALQALEKRDMVFRRDATVFAGSSAYVFKHEMLREVTYDSVLLRNRPTYHKQVADWLAAQSGERVAEYASLIADHYEMAEEKIPAAEMHEMAALRAQEMASPTLALHHYNRVLTLLADSATHTAWKLTIQERVAALLRLQARLVEATATYRMMRQTAENDGDLAAQARALNGLADVMYEQTHYANMLESATRAEKVAWLVSEEAQLALALRLKSQAYQRLGDVALALAAARQALEFSERLRDAPAIVFSLRQLGAMYIDWGRYTHAQHFLARLQGQLTDWRSEEAPPEVVGLAHRALGELYLRLGQYDEAGRNLVLALRLFRQAEWQHDVGRVLYRLGTAARLRGNVAASTPLYREALAVASASGDRYGELFYRVGLGAALTASGFHRAAEKQLKRLIEYAEDKEQIGDWRGLGAAYLFLAETLLGQGNTAVARSAIYKALYLARHMADEKLQGLAWQVLGRTAVQLPPEELPVVWEERPYGPADCFQESLRLLRRAGGNSPSTLRDQALTLHAWASFEAGRGNAQRSQMMQQEAAALAAEVGLAHE
jgi:tetratricopeptide (TPR) repeat protein